MGRPTSGNLVFSLINKLVCNFKADTIICFLDKNKTSCLHCNPSLLGPRSIWIANKSWSEVRTFSLSEDKASVSTTTRSCQLKELLHGVHVGPLVTEGREVISVIPLPTLCPWHSHLKSLFTSASDSSRWNPGERSLVSVIRHHAGYTSDGVRVVVSSLRLHTDCSAMTAVSSSWTNKWPIRSLLKSTNEKVLQLGLLNWPIFCILCNSWDRL